MSDVEYHAEDRSLLLPTYQRWLIAPLVPRLPAQLSPNAITVGGHVLNLTGLLVLLLVDADKGWSFFVAAALLQAYIWCDNADGAHARHTGQCSTVGELLDHGLDILNVAAIAFMGAYALGLPPLGWVAIALLVIGAVSVTYWEQALTGTFRLGRLNQIESGLVLTLLLILSGTMGRTWSHDLGLGNVGAHLILVGWLCITVLAGMVGGVRRVAALRGLLSMRSLTPLALFLGSVCVAFAAGAISTRVAITLITASNVFFAVRMLTNRFRGDAPRFQRRLAAWAIAVGVVAFVILRLTGGEPAILGVFPTAEIDSLLAAIAIVWFGVSALRDVRRSVLTSSSSSVPPTA